MMQYKCPVDETALTESSTDGQPSLRCETCDGAWVTEESLAAIEDRAFSEGFPKGQRRYGEHSAEHECPHCGRQMTRFRYRGYNLEMEACPVDAGYWLDRGEDRRIQDIMRRRESNLRRSGSAQRAWERLRRRGNKQQSLLDRLRDWFRG